MADRVVSALLDRCARAYVDVSIEDGKLVVANLFGHALPADLTDEIRRHRDALVEWLQWEERACVLWRQVFHRLRHRGDLALDDSYRRLEDRANDCHLRHDRDGLVVALRELEAYAARKST